MMDNSTCLWYQTASRKTFFFTYNILTPIYFILGLFGHVLCVLAYFKKAKKEKAYVYQIFVTISESIEITVYALSIAISAAWSGRLAPGQMWFMSSYVCMWIAGHGILPVVNTFITSSALLSVTMAADRMMALMRPIQYKNRKHGRFQLAALIGCMLVAMSTSVVDLFRFNVQQRIDQNETVVYQLVTNAAFTSGQTGVALAHTRSLVRVITVFVLIACNLSMIRSYRSHLKKIETMQINSTDARRRKEERTLTFLAIFQSLTTCGAMGSLSAMTAWVYADPQLYACLGSYFGPISDAITEICTICNFYILIIVRSDFRRMVARALGCLKNEVTTITVSTRA